MPYARLILCLGGRWGTGSQTIWTPVLPTPRSGRCTARAQIFFSGTFCLLPSVPHKAFRRHQPTENPRSTHVSTVTLYWVPSPVPSFSLSMSFWRPFSRSVSKTPNTAALPWDIGPIPRVPQSSHLYIGLHFYAPARGVILLQPLSTVGAAALSNTPHTRWPGQLLGQGQRGGRLGKEETRVLRAH